MTVKIAGQLSALAHQGQTRRDGSPYVQHPAIVSTMLTTDDEKIVAHLHDVIEDCPRYSLATDGVVFYLVEEDEEHNVVNQYQISKDVFEALKALTKVKGQTYEEYISELVTSILAIKVKIADMFHNISDAPTDKQKDKYFLGLTKLLAHI